ncbi:hypothetical protein DIPPA_26890 [Diplonema papillatum]|nr:hypothetical protein DIPPA_26890 [Diplonema papillatum]|eukprot:gene3513-5476_t
MMRASVRRQAALLLRKAHQRRWKSKEDEAKEKLQAEKDAKLAEAALKWRAEQRNEETWKMLAPERQWTLTHPVTWVLLAMIIYMQVSLYIRHGPTLPDNPEEALEKELQRKAKGWD